jgi:hypothetical protein
VHFEVVPLREGGDDAAYYKKLACRGCTHALNTAGIAITKAMKKNEQPQLSVL